MRMAFNVVQAQYSFISRPNKLTDFGDSQISSPYSASGQPTHAYQQIRNDCLRSVADNLIAEVTIAYIPKYNLECQQEHI